MAETSRSRKQQIQQDFKRELVRKLTKNGASLSPSQHRAISQALRYAAMVGAAEERYRTLNIVKGTPWVNEIAAVSVLAVLGYE